MKRLRDIVEAKDNHTPFNPEYPDDHKHVEQYPIRKLKRLRGNNLRHSEDKINAMADDIKKNGLRSPVTIHVDKRTGRAGVGEGNHRVEAAHRAGYTHIPTTAFVKDGNTLVPKQHDVKRHLKPDAKLKQNLKPSDVLK